MRRLLAAVCLALAGTAGAGPVTFEGPAERVAVLELFTSHGCSSCPPADRWLRTLTDHPGLWDEVVPMSFHVDYWDDLGWPDRFARAAFSERQRTYRRVGASGGVYTPGFFINGEEWRGFFRGQTPDLSGGKTVGRLRLDAVPGESAHVRFRPAQPGGRRVAHVAVLGFGLTSAIGGGENAGRTLTEDFVVLGVASSKASGSGLALDWELPWPGLKPTQSTRRAVVAWISAPGHPRPLQAVGGWLP